MSTPEIPQTHHVQQHKQPRNSSLNDDQPIILPKKVIHPTQHKINLNRTYNHNTASRAAYTRSPARHQWAARAGTAAA